MQRAPAPSYRQPSASRFAGDRAGTVAGEFDVMIVGADFTGGPVIGAWHKVQDRLH